MKGTVFYKTTGSGNDFVMLDGRHHAVEDWTPERITAICNRREGVGADGLVILTPLSEGVVRMTFFNSDGSRASMCGNAALCSTRLATFLEMSSSADLQLLTDAGVVRGRCIGPGWLAEIDLPDALPGKAVEGVRRREGEAGFYLSVVGVPHLIVPVFSVDMVDVAVRGRELRFHPALGPDGANVNFVGPITGAADRDPPLAIRTYERGVEGETLACGTGCVAAAVTLAQLGAGTLPLRIRTASGKVLSVGGRLAEGMGQALTLCGEGRIVFRGVLE